MARQTRATPGVYTSRSVCMELIGWLDCVRILPPRWRLKTRSDLPTKRAFGNCPMRSKSDRSASSSISTVISHSVLPWSRRSALRCSIVRPASAITCSTLARLPGLWMVSMTRISGIFMPVPRASAAPLRIRYAPAPALESSLESRSPGSLRGARTAHRRGTVGSGVGRKAGRRRGAAGHSALLRGAPLPARAHPEARGPGTPRLLHHRLRLRRAQCDLLRAHLPGARARGLRHPQFRLRAVIAVHVPDLRLRLGGAEAALPAAHGARGSDRLLRAHRAPRRLRSGKHEDARQAARRR